jgi:carbonic anhydrase
LSEYRDGVALLLAGLLVVPVGAYGASPDPCEQGRRQSPIDIVAPVRQALPPIEFRYLDAPLKIANDGHTMRVRFANGSHIVLGKERYALQQLHFHTPGGDRVAGQEFGMAAHLVHKGETGGLVVIVVLFRKGAENPLLATLLPIVPRQADGEQGMANVRISADSLVPDERGYYSYDGSLTGPPCTEGVTWLVMKQPLELSADQLARYKGMFSDNARPVQPLNGRTVRESR